MDQRTTGLAPMNVDALGSVQQAALDRTYVSLGTRRTASVHEFYRYPARFSPEFARSVINAFTLPGDLVVDPFVGGGTALVEAQRAGRSAVGADLNELAVFVTKAKTTLYPDGSLDAARQWGDGLSTIMNLRNAVQWAEAWEAEGYLRHLDAQGTWRIRNAIALALESLSDIEDRRARLLARCAVLRTGQWALDMRSEIPAVSLFRDKLVEAVHAMADAGAQHRDQVKALARESARESRAPLPSTVLAQGLPGLADHRAMRKRPAPSLILTSPPYPGVYVNYHRWKLKGRKETPAPYWIAGCPDGRGLSHYTMSARVDRTLDKYFTKLKIAFEDLVRIMTAETWVVQLVGFREPASDLPRYLDVMEAVGLTEVRLPGLATALDGRLWREVPGRRWWVIAGQRDTAAPHTSQEVVLIHRLADAGH